MVSKYWGLKEEVSTREGEGEFKMDLLKDMLMSKIELNANSTYACSTGTSL
jgi:hypothetical protein